MAIEPIVYRIKVINIKVWNVHKPLNKSYIIGSRDFLLPMTISNQLIGNYLTPEFI